jgi:hypothetical protein
MDAALSDIQFETYIFDFTGAGSAGGRGADARGAARRAHASGGGWRGHRAVAKGLGSSA